MSWRKQEAHRGGLEEDGRLEGRNGPLRTLQRVLKDCLVKARMAKFSVSLGCTVVIEPTVHLVDDDDGFLLTLSRLLRANGFRVETYSSAVAFLAESRRDEPGCVIVDLSMLHVDGRDLQSALRRTPDPLPVVFLTCQANTASTVRAMRAGAEDVLEKTTEKGALLDAVRRALARNQRAREERLERQALQQRFNALSPREREVLGHLLRGRLNKQIASDLAIHERTVKVHRKSIMIKLDIRSVAALARLSQEAGIPIPASTLTDGNGLGRSR